jgi:hypothetical protein
MIGDVEVVGQQASTPSSNEYATTLDVGSGIQLAVS